MIEQRLEPVIKSVTVPAPVAEAFAVFVERPTEWWPPSHVLISTPRAAVVFEQRIGGRYYDLAVDGTECDWGRIIAWDPPNRIAMTWRINGRWRPVPDDRNASEIEVTFTARGPHATEVRLAHLELHRHGEDATAIRNAIAGPSPGETLARYAAVVATG